MSLWRSHPGDYGEEGEGDGSPGRICPLVEWQLISRGPGPLIGQEAETYKEQEGPETCHKAAEQKQFVATEKKAF